MGDPRTIATKDFLTQLLAEVDETDPEMLPPPGKLESGVKVIGTLQDPYIRKLFSLCSFYRREAQRLEVDLKASGEDPKHNAAHNQLQQKYETLMEIFWLLIRSHLDMWGKSIGIRKGWTVIDTSSENSNDPIERLKRFLTEE